MIRTLGLACTYAGAQPLRFPDVDLPQGGRLLVQGRPGSGQSTWLSLVAGLRPPTAGQVCAAGQPLAVLPGSSNDPHAAEVAVARLRDSMGDRSLVRTVPRRGYRLEVSP